jgi:TetR/AcrR family transcriptional regulator, transcriptional repressor for nem operon
MARAREFNEAVVLDAAIQRFWLSGYEATSVRELADGMGIASASLYNAFGDKRTLYRSSLNRYLDQTFRERIRRLESTLTPADAICEFFEEIIERSVSDKRKRGCLLVNSALEGASEDRDFQQIVNTFLRELEDFFLRSLVAGKRADTISAFGAEEDLARMLVGQLLGIRVLARINPSRTVLEGMVRPIFVLLFGEKKRHLGQRGISAIAATRSDR